MLEHLPPAMVQQFLDSLPAALALVNKDQEIVWANDSFKRITTLSGSQLLGKKIDSLGADVQELFTQGHVYLNATNKRDAYWMACMSVPLGEYYLQYCSDVTQLQNLIEDREGLRTKVAELNPIDQITGMPNRRALFQNLEQQASRSRRYGNSLSTMVLRLSNLSDYIKKYGNDRANELLLSISQMLNDQMRWADVIGRLDKNEFLFILPETEESVTSELRDKIKEHLTKVELPGIEAGQFELITDFGMAQWRKGDDVALLMERVRQNLNGDGEKLAV
ncbi:MAG: diguanylate cyclase [Thioalkalispiraceae bacterium]|jgi:diguanylate cyclase (GGDEF)-like protein